MRKMGMEDLTVLLDKAVRSITGKVARLEMQRLEEPVRMKKERSALFIQTTGDYKATIILNAEDSLLGEITRNMKRGGEASKEDVPVYTTEYFNILCGYFISHLNSYLDLKARFGIPEFRKGCCIKGLPEDVSCEARLYFRCSHGVLCFKAANLPVEGPG